MKTKIILAAAICLLGYLTAQADIKRSTEGWTRNTDAATLRGNAIGNEKPTDDPVPVGDALWIAGLLAGGYGLAKYSRKKIIQL